jgi:Holliday junction resolvase
MARKKKINSRDKGATGEREFAKLLKVLGLEARRGQQFSGGTDSPDVVCPSFTGVHFEVKRVEAGNPYIWYDQAKRDGVGKIPVVAHRKNGEQWLAILDMNDLLDLLITREGTLL